MLLPKFAFRNRSERRFITPFFLFSLLFLIIIISPITPSEEEVDTGWDSATISTELDLNDVAALNSTSAIAVGESGKIFFTDNSGVNWSEMVSGVVQDLNSIESDKESIVVGDSGTVLVSEGDSWVENSILGAGNLHDLSVPHFESLSNSTIFVCGTGGEIWKWTNTSWSDLSSNTGTNVDIYGIDFIDEEKGFAVGANGLIIATIDGGLTWELRDPPEEFREFTFYDLLFFGWQGNPTSLLVVGENGTLIQSSGTGASAIGYIWRVPSEESDHPTGTTNTIRSMSGSSRFKYWVVGDDNYIALTEDGGNSFYNQSQPQTSGVDFTGVSFSNGFDGFLVGEEGVALYTDREGLDPRVLDTAKSFDNFWEYAEYAYPRLEDRPTLPFN